jgi:hypothetical protein
MKICQLWPCPLLGILYTDTVASVRHVSIEAEKKFSLPSCTSPLRYRSVLGEYRGLSSWCLRLALRRCSLGIDVTKLLGSVERSKKKFSFFSLVVKRLFLFLLRVGFGFGEGTSGRYSVEDDTRCNARLICSI